MPTGVCDSCGERPAVLEISQRHDGGRAILRLCDRCASGLGEELPGAAAPLDRLLEGVLGPGARGRDVPLARVSALAEAVLHRAAVRALEWGQARVGVEFLLLAVLEAAPELRAALAEAGVPVDEYAPRLERVVERGPPRPDAGLGLSSGLKRVLRIARAQAAELGHDLVGPEHLLVGVALEGESFAAQFLAAAISPDRLRERVGGPPRAGGQAEELPQHLARYSRDLTALARAGELEPVVGRDAEIGRVIRILSRKTKNNPVLVGEPGVGKTAIAEGLAQRIVAGEVPEPLRERRVLALDLGGLLAGTKFRGDFEQRFQGVVAEVRALRGRAVLFIDEVHTVVGAGGAEGAIDAANLLKPALARGELQCVGATTLDEYRRHIERDAALERRFQPVLVAEPTRAQALEILRGLRDAYEAHHRVTIADAALAAAVELSDRYVSDRFLPDKAIDLVDEAAAMVRLGGAAGPARVAEAEARLADAEREKRAAVAGERYAEALARKADVARLRAELDAVRTAWQERRGTLEPAVGPDDVARVVAEWTGIPVERLRTEEARRLLELEAHLGRRVVGQEEALRAVAEAVRRARTGMKDPARPIGAFLFLGPTGVGKTETARALAEALFGAEDAMIRLDMSEFQERHAVSRLVGAPPGYVGYEEAGRLTEAIRRRPYSVVLLDEIEKAHPDVLDVLLQVLDDGRLTDAKGRTVSFRNAIVVMTSNAGGEALAWRGALGFQGGAGDAGRDAAEAALRDRFRPEFLNRLDEVVVFRPLGREALAAIVLRMLEGTRAKLAERGIALEVAPAAIAALADRGFEPRFGARPLRRAIQREVETPVARMLLLGGLAEGDALRVGFDGAAFVLAPVRAGERAAPGAPA